MKLQFFDSTPSNQNLPFLEEWINQNPKNKTKVFPILEVIRAKSGKGYMLKTEQFIIFVFMNSKLRKDLIEALKVYASRPEGGYALVVHLPVPTKADYQIAVDKDDCITWYEAKNDYTTSEESASLLLKPEAENPFL